MPPAAPRGEKRELGLAYLARGRGSSVLTTEPVQPTTDHNCPDLLDACPPRPARPTRALCAYLAAARAGNTGTC